MAPDSSSLKLGDIAESYGQQAGEWPGRDREREREGGRERESFTRKFP
jgi:hypothetical protein